MTSNMKDAKLFFDIYDTYYMFITNGHYGGQNVGFENEDFLKLILDNEHLLKSIFIKKEYQYIYNGYKMEKLEKEPIIINTINPVINGCLRYAINNLAKYKQQAIEILNFGIKYNKEVYQKLNDNILLYQMSELGAICNQERFIDLLVFKIINKSEDADINKLLDQLPERKNDY